MNGDRVVKVDGGGGIDAVHASVVAAYDLLRGGRAAGLP
jgi:hypothetical protein